MKSNRRGLVVRVDAKVCHVQLDDGRRLLAVPRGGLFEDLRGFKNPIAVGDRVEVSIDGDPPHIEAVLARRNYLGRTASSHDPREQVLVANVDQLLLIGSLRLPDFSSNRTDRILAACAWHDIPAVLVLNKIDLAAEHEIDAVRETYEDAPIEVLETCAADGRGVHELRELMREKVSVLYGPSGAGKSTLLNRLQPGLSLKEGGISSYWRQGRHTTTFSMLHRLDFGAWAIDTPGIRVFRLHQLGRTDLRTLFPDLMRIGEGCRYPDCSHDHEPDCAVFDAVDAGELAASRYASYLEMLEEIEPDRGLEESMEPESED